MTCEEVREKICVFFLHREEQEKLNIWVAYLNLENMYGTHESLNEVFKEALQRNEPIKVYQQLITIYANSGKIEVSRVTSRIKMVEWIKNVFGNEIFLKSYL